MHIISETVEGLLVLADNYSCYLFSCTDAYLLYFKVASELNAAILETDATPKLANLLKLLLWSQEELDKKKIRYPKMTDVASGTIDIPK